MIAPSRPLADVLEKEWQQQVVQLFRTLGWTGFHTFDSRRSNPGFPDLIIVRERLVALELKREQGNVSDKQCEWLRALTRAGVEVYVVRPRHLEQLGLILAARSVFTAPDDPLIPYRLSTDAARAARHELLQELGKELDR